MLFLAAVAQHTEYSTGSEAEYTEDTTGSPSVTVVGNGYFYSLNYLSNYPDNVDSQWLLVASQTHLVSIIIVIFEIPHENFISDRVLACTQSSNF